MQAPSAELRADLDALWKKLMALKAAAGTGTMRG